MGHQQPHTPCVIDGITFASHTEGRRYVELKSMQKAGIITEFVCQPKYVLQEAYRKCPACNAVYPHVPGSQKKIHIHCRECGEKLDYWEPVIYIADFKVIYPDGRITIEDVKGSEKFLDPTFKLKRRIFNKVFPDLRIDIVILPPVRKKRVAQKVMNKARKRWKTPGT